MEVEILEIDISFSERKEADFIKKLFNVFDKEVRIKFLKIIERLSSEEKNNKEIKK